MKENLILTIEGWKPLSKCKKGEKVFDGKGNLTTISSIRTKESNIYKITYDDHSISLIDENTKIDFYRYDVISQKRLRDKEGHLLEKRDIISDNVDYSMTAKEIIDILKSKTTIRNKRLRIKNVSIKGLKTKLLVPPYILGIMLGDGTISKTTKTPTFTCNTSKMKGDPDIAMFLEKYCKSIGDYLTPIRKGKWKKTMDFRINGMHLKELLQKIGVYGHDSTDKYIPVNYLLADRESRLQLIRGLMDTDGFITLRKKQGRDTGYNYGFEVVSKLLADGLDFLLHSLGYANTKGYKAENFYIKNGMKFPGKPVFRNVPRVPSEVSLFNCKRKKDREIKYKEKHTKLKTVDKTIKKIDRLGKGKYYYVSLSNGCNSYIGSNWTKINCK